MLLMSHQNAVFQIGECAVQIFVFFRVVSLASTLISVNWIQQFRHERISRIPGRVNVELVLVQDHDTVLGVLALNKPLIRELIDDFFNAEFH